MERKETWGLTSLIKKSQTTRHPNLPISSNGYKKDIENSLLRVLPLAPLSLSNILEQPVAD